jgi:hypothetical protein
MNWHIFRNLKCKVVLLVGLNKGYMQFEVANRNEQNYRGKSIGSLHLICIDF